MRHRKPKPLDFFDARKMTVAPPHFVYTPIESVSGHRLLEQWIINNLSGRYYVGHRVTIVHDKVQTVLHVGFENPSELSLFTLYYLA